MPSIMHWSRLEPRPRMRCIANSLAARVHDPLWMLTRQWQFGEFRGEDAGSPAFVQMVAKCTRLRNWSPEPGDAQPLPAAAPLEAVALAEDFSQTDLSLAVELGQVFEQALVDGGRADLIAVFREAYPLKEHREEVKDRDRDAVRFLMVATGRCTDGVKLFLAAEGAQPDLPADPTLADADKDDVRAAIEQLRTWVRDTIGQVGSRDAPAWNPERLEYNLEVVGQEPGGGEVTLSAHPDRDGRFAWHAFDVSERSPPGEGSEDESDAIRRSVIPANVSFRGMPNARWWAFETGTTNFAAIRPEKREIAKLIVLDFMLVHSNDWYTLPFAQPLGTLCRIESLVVHDLFGGKTLIERTDRGPAPAGQRWTMFSTSVAGSPDVGEFFLLAPTIGSAGRSSDAREEVRFVRDEMANMAWAIERIVENGIGEPWPAHERSAARLETDSSPSTASEDESSLHYQIQTSVPEHWIPFLPVAIDASRRDVQFERGILLRSASEEAVQPEPAGRILRPTRLPEQHQYKLREEEIPRVGLRVVRLVNRSRWMDGSTHIWLARRKTFGADEERSGLRYDLAVPLR